MAVTYVEKKYGLTGVKFPVLHRVVYARTTDGVMSAYQHSYKDHLVESWLIIESTDLRNESTLLA